MRLHRGFSLIEVMVSVVILAVIAAFAVPSVIGLVRLARARNTGETVAAILEEGRTRATAEGRCFRVSAAAGGTQLQLQRLSSADCVDLVDPFDAPVRTTALSSGSIATVTDTAGVAGANKIIFRPSSRLRGNGTRTVTQYGARVVITVPGAFAVVNVTALGRICASTSVTAPPAIAAPVLCP
ncbi:MAG TPA: prepilin-type N-terminal cleavage/methylation domain-containing protein [Myxococcota bacterium]|jgi:type IV fimbrial biogenesis protein FimT